jgi:hypothetical protein
VADEDWPAWRGPDLTGVARGEAPPTNWSKSENVIWKAAVPGRGHGSATVCGNRVYVPTADESAKTQSLLALDRETGDLLWNRTLHEGGLVHAHGKNSHASATPACDGQRVFITFLNADRIWLSAVDLEGNVIFQKEAGPFVTQHGYAASPALYKSLVIVAADSANKSFLAALDRQTGEMRWRVPRPGANSFASPLVAHVAGRDQVLISGCEMTAAYDPMTGSELWRCNGPTTTVAATMTFAGNNVYISGGYPGAQTLCIRADGSGDVTGTHIVWSNARKFYVPSLLVHEGLLYAVSDDGVAWCYEADTGKQLWQQRLGGGFSASPVLAGPFVFAINEAGRTFVWKAGRSYEAVAQNDLGEGGFATPTIAGGRIYLRTEKSLYCIGTDARVVRAR